MNTTKLLTIAVLLIVSTSITKAQSEEATINWLTEKIKFHFEGTPVKEANSLMEATNLRVGEFTACKFVLIYDLWVTTGNNSPVKTSNCRYEIPVKGLGLSIEQNSKYVKGHVMTFKFSNKVIQNKINASTLTTDDAGLITFKTRGETDMTSRILKAFGHLEQICLDNEVF